VPLDTKFDHEDVSDQHAALSDIQLASYRAGLRGRVMVIWKTPSGGSRFIAPPSSRCSCSSCSTLE
jgi:hypothetical protein